MAAGCTINRLETSVRGLILKLSFKVALTRVFTARKFFWAVIWFFHRFSPIQFL